MARITAAPPPNSNDVGYDVILLAGQSNMSGRGTAYDTTHYDPPNPRIAQYGNSGTYANVISQAIEPLAMHDTPTGIGPGMEFARWYLHAIPPNRRILLVPVAHGGTAFESDAGSGFRWKVGYTPSSSSLYEDAITQANAALAAAGPNSRLTVILWHQGETDGDNSCSGPTYQSDFDALIDGFRSRITGATNALFVLGQMVPDYLATGTRSAINSVHIDTPRRKLLSGFAYGTSGNNNNDGNHYNATGARLMGRAMFDAWRAAQRNVLGYAPASPSAPTLTQSGTTMTVSWSTPLCRVTDYVIEYKLSPSSTWTTLTHSQSLAATYPITGLTLGSSYDVRISTVNEQGTSAPSAVSTLVMAAVPGQVTGLINGTATLITMPLNWTAVTGATSYLIEYKKHADSSWTSFGTVATNSGTVTALLNNTSYDFRVSASNAAGTGTVSSTLTASTAAPTPLMDDVGVTAWRAYSFLSKLRTGATSALTVRRSSDNGTLAIGFSGTNVDWASALTFVGSGDGYLAGVSDQSGSAHDITIASTANQPKLITAGVLNVISANNIAAALFDGVANYIGDSTPGMYAAGSATICGVLAGASQANARVVSEASTSSTIPQYSVPISSSVTGARMNQYIRNDANAVLCDDVSPSTPNLFDSNIHQFSLADSGSSVSKFVDGAAAGVSSYTRSGTLTLNTFSIGALHRSSIVSPFAGSIVEIIVWAPGLTTLQRQTAEANQKARCGTP